MDEQNEHKCQDHDCMHNHDPEAEETTEELVQQHEDQIQALINILIDKGVLTEAEILRKMDDLYEEEPEDDIE